MIETKPSGTYYKIENLRDMPPFFINIASASDVWMFLSSNGAPAAGRSNPSASIFPYESDDRLHLATHTGPKTLIRLSTGCILQPFDTGFDNPHRIRRNIYKRVTGDAVMFEEIYDDLGIIFTYRWETSETYGLVRTSAIKYVSEGTCSFEILDGVENLIPHGIPPAIASNLTCLADAYKACERPDSGRVAVYSLTSTIGDTVKPVEILRANTAWFIGNGDTFLLSSKQVRDFAAGLPITDEVNSVGRKGAFFTHQKLTLNAQEEKSWMMIFDAGCSQQQVVALVQKVNHTDAATLRQAVLNDIAKGTDELIRYVATADGLQLTNNPNGDIRHYMNVLYNNMRGGVFLDRYNFDVDLFVDFISKRDKGIAARCADFIGQLKADGVSTITELHRRAFLYSDADMIRLALEFLPLTFSRRHGDPSRPWNYFDIRIKDENGAPVYHYEGNWRDIFQNWEALGLSFPDYFASIIAKFLNASTPDGFNPYRINTEGIDWETPAPHDPWAGIGYWGDHQIVYLNKLLEWFDAYNPNTLVQFINNEVFSYADVPYEIAPYESILKDSKHTIRFNHEKNDRLVQRARQNGSDGRLLAKDNRVYHVSFTEKLLVPILAKLSNLVIGGGIWMNTQRPEWNDANNAIVGNGLSMVTVYQLYRHLHCCAKLATTSSVSTEVKAWFDNLHRVYANRAGHTPRAFLDASGAAFCQYRKAVYTNGFSGKETLTADALKNFYQTAIQILRDTINANQRDDGMYHSYNIMTLTDDSLSVSPLSLMLEGQTAVLGSGCLGAAQAHALTTAMENSDLMNPLLGQFYLYPIKTLKSFVDRNIIPPEYATQSALIQQLLDSGHDGLILRDVQGHVRFHHAIKELSIAEAKLAELQNNPTYQQNATHDAPLILEIFEVIFAHKQFTGRSGIMYKYEGIGSIYWHQNSKFMLSLQEVFTSSSENKANDKSNRTLTDLKATYYRLQNGFGFCKKPTEWGAFPLEPYSHTPYAMPAQQPGMTGQVKEDILTRVAELGVAVKNGVLSFNPTLLRREEFLVKPSDFRYINTSGTFETLEIPTNTLAFTVCQVPVVYHLGHTNKIIVTHNNTQTEYANTSALTKEISTSLFNRNGTVKQIDVWISPDLML
ncbi:MAG: hypothetical protein FWC71_02270 [Defluviitaleaceae bacterium]|nr:hypothetical protein [Defluviitaleaceae bacterium]